MRKININWMKIDWIEWGKELLDAVGFTVFLLAIVVGIFAPSFFGEAAGIFIQGLTISLFASAIFPLVLVGCIGLVFGVARGLFGWDLSVFAASGYLVGAVLFYGFSRIVWMAKICRRFRNRLFEFEGGNRYGR